MTSTFDPKNLPSDKITVFDIKFNDGAPENSVSPWTRIVINAVRIKKIPHHIELVEMIDIPAISQYLDERYPETPTLVTKGTEGLIAAFQAAYSPIDMKLLTVLIPKMMSLMIGNTSEAHFRETRTKVFGGKPLESLIPVGEEAEKFWEEVQSLYDGVDSWYGNNTFIMGGEHPTYSDFSVAGRLWWYRSTLGSASQEWKRIASWNEGRWARLITYFDNYAK
ncbi:hypothetical protein CVT24_011555 [Panaeolus cyanescens]|uniref:Glutathione S-transferase UstS-like C-terminal domain-containing protein n=1 Tax=Panaeolus cyanescens TaxID=181874 RepID=A0A409VLZ9_9AGAR|nr:hypothetical protein CVT24_011555 [Panaeolus cyanescens]